MSKQIELENWFDFYSHGKDYRSRVQQYGNLDDLKTWELAGIDSIKKLHIKAAEMPTDDAHTKYFQQWVAMVEADFQLINRE